ncbi:hypothetical protein ACFQT0_19390 [Hymenobacter humi]|uniref:Uncharacterized protein n=1 Tax=Hymenobacter humi TaxID=1411620 RepID=A0ABW2UAE9_9BACT
MLPEPVEFYIDGQLRWVGALVYLDCDEEKRMFSYNFVADAADLQSRIDGVSLTSLEPGPGAPGARHQRGRLRAALPAQRRLLRRQGH